MSVYAGSGVFDEAQRAGALPDVPPPVTLGGRALSVVGTARVYTCGITPYDVTHLGHAATFCWADLLVSVLRSRRVRVSSCRNVTDVDDVLTDAARERGRHYDELAVGQQFLFDRSMTALRVATPEHQPRARQHVEAVQQLAAALLERDAAYERDGTVWFRGRGVQERSGLDDETALGLLRGFGEPAAVGYAAGDGPADPFDVPVWRRSGAEHPGWPSPWGWGRPGWHAGCAAMALEVHGASVDVLVGGVDLAFPHHAYQAGMAAAASGVEPFARAVLHVGEVRVDGEKMAKSTGNLVLVDDVLTDVDPAALRLLLLARPHDEAWDYHPGLLDGAAAMLDALYAAAGRTVVGAAGAGAATGAGAGADPQGDPEAAVARVLYRDLDVVGAVRTAIDVGGEVARWLLRVLRLV